MPDIEVIGHAWCTTVEETALSMKRLMLALALTTAPAAAQLDPPAWTRPIAPFRIVGGIWYVGSEGLAAYLVKTPRGAILVDATMAENVPAIERNIVAAGVELSSVRYLLVSHGHFDHAAGDAAIRAATGAKVVAGTGDVAALESGIPPGEVNYGVIRFPPVEVARGIRDGESVRLGGVTMTAVATPGHTPGCTTWTTTTVETGRKLRVVFPCSVSVAGNKLIDNKRYPTIVADFRRSLAKLNTLGADVVLPAHPEGADVLVRHAKGGPDAFIAPNLLGEIVAKSTVAFEAELAKQSAAK